MTGILFAQNLKYGIAVLNLYAVMTLNHSNRRNKEMAERKGNGNREKGGKQAGGREGGGQQGGGRQGDGQKGGGQKSGGR
jgi:hypothetical protein